MFFVVGILGDFFLGGEKDLIDSVDFVSDILEGNRLQHTSDNANNCRRVAILCKTNYAGSGDSSSCFQRLV